MKTIAVVSDSHGNRAALDKLFPVFSESDYIIHLGDTSSDGAYIKKAFPSKTYLLNGNCDLTKCGESELELQIEDIKLFACHGDKFGVKYSYEKLAAEAAKRGCAVALFGHTHRAVESESCGVSLFNPGTLSRYSRNTYLYLVISGGKAVGKIVELK